MQKTSKSGFFARMKANCLETFAGFKQVVTQAKGRVSASMLIMGLGQLLYKQWIKGALYLLAQIGFILYFVFRGAQDFIGFFTLGVRESNAWYGIEGDNSVIMMLMGILSIIAILFYVALYIANVKDAYNIQIGRAHV